mgnify:FL=1
MSKYIKIYFGYCSLLTCVNLYNERVLNTTLKKYPLDTNKSYLHLQDKHFYEMFIYSAISSFSFHPSKYKDINSFKKWFLYEQFVPFPHLNKIDNYYNIHINQCGSSCDVDNCRNKKIERMYSICSKKFLVLSYIK